MGTHVAPGSAGFPDSLPPSSLWTEGEPGHGPPSGIGGRCSRVVELAVFPFFLSANPGSANPNATFRGAQVGWVS